MKYFEADGIMRCFTQIILCLFAFTQPICASCICPDGTESKTEQEIIQEKQALEIRLHNLTVMNQRAEASIKEQISKKEKELVDATVIINIDSNIYSK